MTKKIATILVPSARNVLTAFIANIVMNSSTINVSNRMNAPNVALNIVAIVLLEVIGKLSFPFHRECFIKNISTKSNNFPSSAIVCILSK